MEAFRGDCDRFGQRPLVKYVPFVNETSISTLNSFQAVTFVGVKILCVTTWSDETITRNTSIFPTVFDIDILDPERNVPDQYSSTKLNLR